MRFSSVWFLACACPALSHPASRGSRKSKSSHSQDDGPIPHLYSWAVVDEFSIPSTHPPTPSGRSPKASTPTVRPRPLLPPSSPVHDGPSLTGRPVRNINRDPAPLENHASHEPGGPTSGHPFGRPHHLARPSVSAPTPHFHAFTSKAPSHHERPANLLAPYVEDQRTIEPFHSPFPAPLPGSVVPVPLPGSVVHRPSQLPATINPEPDISSGPASTRRSFEPTAARTPSFAYGSNEPTAGEIGRPSHRPAGFESVPTPYSEPAPGRVPSMFTDRPASTPSNPDSSDDPPFPGVPTSFQSPAPAPPVHQPSLHSDGSLPPALFEPSNHEVCKSSDGNFGSFDGESSILSYAYELETAAVTQAELLQTILPALEVTITNVLLPVFFDGCYQKRHRLATQIDGITDHRQPRRLRMVGISSHPVDAPLQDMKCNAVARDNSCSVVRGELTLHFSDQQEASSETELIRKVLQQVMGSGAFDEGVHENIVRVSYVDASALLENEDHGNRPNAAATPTSTSQQSERLGSSFVVGLVLAAAALILVVGLVVAHRRRQNRLRRRAARGEPVSSGPPSPARESDGPTLDPLVDRTTAFTVDTTADAAQPVDREVANIDNTDNEGRSEGSVYLLEGPESGQDDRQLSLAMSPIQFVEELCVGSCTDGPDVAHGEVPIRTILVPDRLGADDDEVRKAAANLSSPSDESVYLGSASSKDESQFAMRFT